MNFGPFNLNRPWTVRSTSIWSVFQWSFSSQLPLYTNTMSSELKSKLIGCCCVTIAALLYKNWALTHFCIRTAGFNMCLHPEPEPLCMSSHILVLCGKTLEGRVATDAFKPSQSSGRKCYCDTTWYSELPCRPHWIPFILRNWGSQPPSLHNALLIEKHLGIMTEVLLSG